MLDEILKQSKDYRTRVALLATFVIGIAIFSAWLVIAGYNLKKQALKRLIPEEQTVTAQQFKKNLPSLRQDETIVTELSKQSAGAKAGDVISEEERNSFLEKLFNK